MAITPLEIGNRLGNITPLSLPDTAPPYVTQFHTIRGKEKIVKPLPPEQLRRVGQGIDIKPEHSGKPKYIGYLYEDICFEAISGGVYGRDNLVIGPHLLDRLFELGCPEKIRPDLLRLNTRQPSVWVINEVFECKSGETKTGRKTSGFADLFSDMRKNEKLLPDLFKKLMPWLKENEIPERVVLPLDRKLGIVFVTPRLTEGIVYDRRLKFQVSHLYVPMPKDKVSLESVKN